MLIIFYLFFFLLLIDFVSLHTVMPGEHPWPHLCVFLQYYEPTLFWLNKMIFKGTFLWYFSSPPPKKKLQKADSFLSSCFWGFYFFRCWEAHVLHPLSFSFFLPPQCVCMIWNSPRPVCAAWVIRHMWTITNFIWGESLLSECPRQSRASPGGTRQRRDSSHHHTCSTF